jgi:hypothetical protein
MQCVVEVVGDPAGHLPERAQALLLNDAILRLAQIVERARQPVVRLEQL